MCIGDIRMLNSHFLRWLAAWPIGMVGTGFALIGVGLVRAADLIHGDDWDVKYHDTPTPFPKDETWDPTRSIPRR